MLLGNLIVWHSWISIWMFLLYCGSFLGGKYDGELWSQFKKIGIDIFPRKVQQFLAQSCVVCSTVLSSVLCCTVVPQIAVILLVEIFAFSLCFFSNFLLLTARLFLLTLPIFQKDWKNIKKPKNVSRSWNAMTTEQVSFNFYVRWCNSTGWHSGDCISGDIMNRVLALPGWDMGMSTVAFFSIYLQRNFRRRKRTRLWRSWPLRWSKTCRWRSAASTFDMKTTWVLTRRRSQSSFRFKSLWSVGESY